ncbi:MAG: hypothetical protein ACKO6B_00950 [Planctomycetia bacterium]
MNESRELFLRLSGIDIADVATPHRLLRLAADEQNPQAVEQAAARLLAQLRAAADRIPAPHLDWMTQQVTQARNFMLLQCGPARPGAVPPPPVPAPMHVHQLPAADPPIVVRPTVPRRRPAFDAENLLGILGILVMLAVAGVGAKLFYDDWWKDTIRPAPPGPSTITKPAPPPDVEPVGGGPKPRPKPDPAPPRPEPNPKPQPRGDRAKALVRLKSAFANVRKGFFDEADLDAQKALMAAPDCDEAQAMRLAVAYVRQYPQLPDEALAALNENDVVDLGPEFGRAAFISRDGAGSVTFQVKGRPQSFTSERLKSMSEVRFRVTESFLDNANNPANDLILGACHFVKRLDGDGNVDREGTVASGAARERWRKAELAGEGQIGEQAGMLLKLLDMELPD